jgi:hypothetical protein
VPSALPATPTSVVIAIDPHKASRAAVADGQRLQPIAAIGVGVDRDGYRKLRRFACRWPHAVWAIEGATALALR